MALLLFAVFIAAACWAVFQLPSIKAVRNEVEGQRLALNQALALMTKQWAENLNDTIVEEVARFRKVGFDACDDAFRPIKSSTIEASDKANIALSKANAASSEVERLQREVADMTRHYKLLIEEERRGRVAAENAERALRQERESVMALSRELQKHVDDSKSLRAKFATLGHFDDLAKKLQSLDEDLEKSGEFIEKLARKIRSLETAEEHGITGGALKPAKLPKTGQPAGA